MSKYVYERFRKKSNPDCKLVHNEDQFIEKEGQMEFFVFSKWSKSTTCKLGLFSVHFQSKTDIMLTKKCLLFYLLLIMGAFL